ncbi:MAG: hypothetical protein WD768_22160 [Phycisphaeraceae bacterium]
MSTTKPPGDDWALIVVAILLDLATGALICMEGWAAPILSLITGLVAFGFGGLAALSGRGRVYRWIGGGVMFSAAVLLFFPLQVIAFVH